ncbi:neocarzinostatin apoprotein domain-containing protein [Micromonospora sp. RV43]|uniref:neocarzinostatin apoprotein domain-containing protein n=1 Tax=Micromonospora sp. RV43 TaxID=1661387 RepID=UPI00064B9BFD|nr:neocarzinostatin apoprotein domain-containing protein [Micromonospora sp. RV43]
MRARRRTILTTVLLTAAVVATPAPAHAGTATGSGGQKLTVTPSTGLSRSGATVSVSGRGYDVDKGIYVAYCVDNGPGVAATPCGGGADTTGSLGASQWISSNPPAYAEGLPKPYGPGGSFSVTVKVTPTIGDVDCTVRRCAVVTRADHTRASDRSQDVRVPVTFAAGATSAPPKAGPAPKATTPAAAPRTATAQDAPAPAASGSAPAAAGAAGVTGAATGAGAPSQAAAGDLHVTRVSDTSGAGRGWTAGVVAAALALAVLLGLGRWRRRRGAGR